MTRISNALLVACGVLAAAPAAAQDYMMPWERAEADKPKIDPDKVETVEVESGRMEILRLPPVDGLGQATVISSHPEVAELHVEAPDLLFVFGHRPGVTNVVIANADKDAIWSATVTVHPKGYFEE
jgi:Flp pilus assembly secretin CpaC